MRVRIDSIIVAGRHRKELGDISSLAASINTLGLLHPIVITPTRRLIAGERRLAAAKSLGWEEIPVTIVDLGEIVRGEHAENYHRKDFTPSEMVAIGRALEDQVSTPHGGDRSKVENYHLEDREPGKTRDKVAAYVGTSGRTYEKAKEVIEAAEQDPERFGNLVDEMDRTGKVTGAHRKLKMAKDEERIDSIVPAEGRYKTLVIDPPWDYEWLSLAGRAAPGYATMSHEELLALDVPAWADDDFCHLYLWTTNNFLTRAVELMEHWGFQHKTMLTWVKPRWGLGSYFRNSTEQCLFGVKGTQNTRTTDIATHFEAPVGAHSEKPEEFYDIVRRASFGPYGEGFQRKDRPDFANLFEEKEVA